MFIQTEQTPNPATLKFLPGRQVMPSGTANFTSADAAVRGSPIAERLFTARLGPHAQRFGVGSAGTIAVSGAPMSPRAADAIADLGGGAGLFAARQLTADLVGSADVVLGLAREHREAAVRMCPAALRRC